MWCMVMCLAYVVVYRWLEVVCGFSWFVCCFAPSGHRTRHAVSLLIAMQSYNILQRHLRFSVV